MKKTLVVVFSIILMILMLSGCNDEYMKIHIVDSTGNPIHLTVIKAVHYNSCIKVTTKERGTFTTDNFVLYEDVCPICGN